MEAVTATWGAGQQVQRTRTRAGVFETWTEYKGMGRCVLHWRALVRPVVVSPTLQLARIKCAWNGLGAASDAMTWDFPRV